MTIEDDISFLERVPTLSILGRQALRILAIGAESRYVHRGDTLFSAGDQADCGYVVQEGSFALKSGHAGQASSEFVVGSGTLLGEVALVADTVRPATAVALEPSTVIRVSRNLFLKMLEGYPDAARRLRDTIAARADQAAQDIQSVRGALAPPGPRK
jgi:CRP-like cAMP-binding protein